MAKGASHVKLTENQSMVTIKDNNNFCEMFCTLAFLHPRRGLLSGESK